MRCQEEEHISRAAAWLRPPIVRFCEKRFTISEHGHLRELTQIHRKPMVVSKRMLRRLLPVKLVGSHDESPVSGHLPEDRAQQCSYQECGHNADAGVAGDALVAAQVPHKDVPELADGRLSVRGLRSGGVSQVVWFRQPVYGCLHLSAGRAIALASLAMSSAHTFLKQSQQAVDVERLAKQPRPFSISRRKARGRLWTHRLPRRVSFDNHIF